MKRMLIVLLSLLLVSAAALPAMAEENLVTYAELKAQAPQRLQMTVTSDAGYTIEVDAPVILPEAEHLPVLLCKNWHFEGERSDCIYQPKGSQDLLYGQTDRTDRYPLPMGATPPENDFTLEQAMALIMENNQRFGGDPTVDLRVNRVAAMSGLCKTKSAKVTDESTGVSYRAIVADPEKPVKGKEKGVWFIETAQYLRGARVLPEGSNGIIPLDGIWHPDTNTSANTIMNAENYALLFDYLREESVLTDDVRLADWSMVENSIRELIRQDKLKSVYQVELVYIVKTTRATNELWAREGLTEEYVENDTYVLVPGWEIKGYGMNDRNADRFVESVSPDRETVLMNSIGQDRIIEEYTLRLNGEDASLFVPEDVIFDLENGGK